MRPGPVARAPYVTACSQNPHHVFGTVSGGHMSSLRPLEVAGVPARWCQRWVSPSLDGLAAPAGLCTRDQVRDMTVQSLQADDSAGQGARPERRVSHAD